MADAFVSTTTLTNQVKAAYDRSIALALREGVVFDQFATVRPAAQAMPGSTVVMTIWTDLAVATTPLTETTDPDSVSLSDAQITITLNEYGNVVISTRKLRGLGFNIAFDSDIAEKVAWNATDTIDTLARTELETSANISFGSSTSAATAATQLQNIAADRMDANRLRIEHAKLAAASVYAWDQGARNYACIMHPDVSYDLKTVTGDAGWLAPKVNVDPAGIYNNEIGTFGGFRVVETSRANKITDEGSGAVDNYVTYFIGRECLAKAVAVEPSIEIGVVADKLNRLFPVGWYTLAGWKLYRAAATRLNKSASSIGVNV
jgi:N4-gp56 family major capsid protein